MSQPLTGECWTVFFTKSKRFITMDDIDWENKKLQLLFYRVGEFLMDFEKKNDCCLFFDEKRYARLAQIAIDAQNKKLHLPYQDSIIKKIPLHIKNYMIYLPNE